MVDIREHVAYWRDGAKDDWDAAGQLIERGKIRQGMFFAHLALEKLLKAHVCKNTGKLAPKIHNLLNPADIEILAEMNEFNLEGRYPISFIPPPTKNESLEFMKKAEGLFEWLTQKL